MILDITEVPDRFVSILPSLAPIALKFDFSLLTNPDFYVIMFTFLFTDFFDTVGTLVGVPSRADFRDEERRLPRAKQTLMADAIATCAGAVMGTSTVTAYVESASGVEEGGKTELTSVVVAGLFLFADFHIAQSSRYSGICDLPGSYHGRNFHDSELKRSRF